MRVAGGGIDRITQVLEAGRELLAQTAVIRMVFEQPAIQTSCPRVIGRQSKAVGRRQQLVVAEADHQATVEHLADHLVHVQTGGDALGDHVVDRADAVDQRSHRGSRVFRRHVPNPVLTPGHRGVYHGGIGNECPQTIPVIQPASGFHQDVVHADIERLLAVSLQESIGQRLVWTGVLEHEVGVFPGAQAGEFVFGLVMVGLGDVVRTHQSLAHQRLHHLAFSAGRTEARGCVRIELTAQNELTQQGLLLLSRAEGHTDHRALVEDQIPAPGRRRESQDTGRLDAVEGLEHLDQGQCA